MESDRIRIKIPDSVSSVMKMLNDAGHEAYLVGGSVRDSVMGREVHDYDVTTSALPEEMLVIFSGMKIFTAGLKHGTVTVRGKSSDGDPEKDEWVEVTTFRVDGGYSDGRHPDSVRFTRTLREDLSRRDFTVNAMAYSEKNGIEDLFGGIQDIERKKVRCVGDPNVRFTEDALRILRAFRFSAKLGFDIDGDTLAAAERLRERLRLISAERIAAELNGILAAEKPSKVLKLMLDAKITDVILPKTQLTSEDIAAADKVPSIPELRFGAILRGKSRDDVSTAMHSLKYSNAYIQSAVAAAVLPLPHDNTPLSVRKFAGNCGIHAENVLLAAGARGETASDGSTAEELMQILGKIRSEGDPLTVGDLAANGKDLISAGIPAGPDIGRITAMLLDLVLNDPSLNDRKTLVRLALDTYSEKTD